MAKVTLIFTGVGLVYRKGTIWKIIFPFDDNNCHRVQFEHDGEHIPLNKPGTSVFIDVGNSTAPIGTGMTYSRIFDLTAAEVHPNVGVRANWQDHAVILSISKKAIMSMHRETESRYQLKRGASVDDLAKIAFSLKAEIVLNQGETLTIDVTDHRKFPKTFSGTEDNEIIIFNNNCLGNPSSEQGDLQMLYDYIIDVPPAQQFTIERHPEDKPTIRQVLGFTEPDEVNQWLDHRVVTMTELFKYAGEVLTEKSHNPKYNELGLPCYIVKAENSTNLP